VSGPPAGRRRRGQPRWLLGGLVLGLGAALAWQRSQDLARQPPLQLLLDAPAAPKNAARRPDLGALQLDLPAGGALAHAPSLLQRPDGTLLVAWFAGSYEAADDVVLRLAAIRRGRLVQQWQALNRQELAQQLQRSVHTLGNPVLWQQPDGQGPLGLLLVSVSYGRWSGSAINQLQSWDGGHHWGQARRLITSPLFNVSTLVRQPPLPLQDGGILVPAYHELTHYWPLALRLDRHGTLVAMDPLPVRSTSQPAMVTLGRQQLVAWLRDHRRERHRLLLSAGRAEGILPRWGAARDGGWPNPNSAVAALRLRQGQVLVALNPEVRGRARLSLLALEPGGLRLRPLRQLEPSAPLPTTTMGSAPAPAYAYPALAESDQGGVWVAYSVNKHFIRLRHLPAQELIPPGNAAAR
jgi:predicted neuraminidase